jgi:hypothetical protein
MLPRRDLLSFYHFLTVAPPNPNETRRPTL